MAGTRQRHEKPGDSGLNKPESPGSYPVKPDSAYICLTANPFTLMEDPSIFLYFHYRQYFRGAAARKLIGSNGKPCSDSCFPI